jgi:integrase
VAIEEIIQSFLEAPEQKALTKSSRDLYRHALNHLTVFAKTVRVLREDTSMLTAFVGYLTHKKLSGTTIRQYVNVVKIMFKFHGRPIDFTYKMPTKEKRKKQAKDMERWFLEDDMEKISANRRNLLLRNQIIIQLLRETGMRVKELANLGNEDIFICERTCWIRNSKTQPRPAFFSPSTMRLFISWVESMNSEAWRNLKVKKGILTGEKFKLCVKGKPFPNPAQIKKIVSDFLTDIGLKNGADGRGPHTFRHYVATILYYEGNMALEDIATLLGDTPETIRRHYLHPTPRMLQERVDKAMRWK